MRSSAGSSYLLGPYPWSPMIVAEMATAGRAPSLSLSPQPVLVP